MGLISFLKEKFSKKKTEDVESYSEGMAKSRQNFSSKLNSLSKKYKKVNQDYFEELEEILIESDVGVKLTLQIIDEVLEESKKKHITDAEEINEILIDHMFDAKLKVYTKKMKPANSISSEDIVTSVVMPVDSRRTQFLTCLLLNTLRGNHSYPVRMPSVFFGRRCN